MTNTDWHSDFSMSFTQVECADGTKPGRLAGGIFEGESKRPLMRIGAASDDPRDVAANIRLVLASKEMLTEIRKQIAWLQHVRQELDGVARESILMGVDQSIKGLSAVANKVVRA